MSKSLGNSLFAADLLAAARPVVLRYFLGSAHYRSVLEFSDTSLAEAAAAFERIEGFLERAGKLAEAAGAPIPAPGEGDAASRLPAAFVEAMLDDFAVPQALAALHGAVRAGNAAIDSADTATALARAAEVAAMLDVLGLDPRADSWAAPGGSAPGDASASALDHLVRALIEQRAEARANKDFAASDAIRDRLLAAGVALEDTPNGTRWSLS
jgi:cysteinyl-tRNA synthetase